MSTPKFADGFAEDACAIMLKFRNCNGSSFKSFCDIWTDMKFGQIFTGRRSIAEVMEISEEFLDMAKYFLIYINDTKLKIGGLYLIYSLYYCQPLANFAKIRLIRTEWLSIREWWSALDKNTDDEPIFIFLKLYYDNAFKFVVENRVYGFEKSIHKYFKEVPCPIMMPFIIVMENPKTLEDEKELQSLAANTKTLNEDYQIFRTRLKLQTESNSDISTILKDLAGTRPEPTQILHKSVDGDQCNSAGKRRQDLKKKAFGSNSASFKMPENIEIIEDANETSDEEEDDPKFE